MKMVMAASCQGILLSWKLFHSVCSHHDYLCTMQWSLTNA